MCAANHACVCLRYHQCTPQMLPQFAPLHLTSARFVTPISRLSQCHRPSDTNHIAHGAFGGGISKTRRIQPTHIWTVRFAPFRKFLCARTSFHCARNGSSPLTKGRKRTYTHAHTHSQTNMQPSTLSLELPKLSAKHGRETQWAFAC